MPLDPADVPSRAGIQAAIDAMVKQNSSGSVTIGPMLIQWGTATVVFSAVTNATVTIAYPKGFSGPATVIPVCQGSSALFAYLPSSPGASNAALGLRSYSSTSTTGNFPVAWIAVGPA